MMMTNGKQRLGEAGSIHLYEATVIKRSDKSWAFDRLQARITIEIEANNRDQAERIAENAGYGVCDMNMIG